MKARLSVTFAAGAWLSAAAAQPVIPELPKPAGIPLPENTTLPAWPKPLKPHTTPGVATVRSGELELLPSADQFGGLLVRVAGKEFAVGPGSFLVGYLKAGSMRWCNLSELGTGKPKLLVHSGGASLETALEAVDPDGAHWAIAQRFSPGRIAGSIDIEVQVRVDQERAVAFLPMLIVFPGAGTFGERKGQGLLAGLEYLENEPSSSEADLTGPAARRQVPDTLKLTFPLMAIQNDGCYLALSWQMRPHFCAVFDSPDRLFGSGGHVMGILFPGSTAESRQEGSLLPRVTEKLAPGGELVLRATLLGGRGQTVADAVRQYVALHPLPGLPGADIDRAAYVSAASGAWLDSNIRVSNRVHHAIMGGTFPLQPAADAALWTRWLAQKSKSSEAVAARLAEASSALLAAVSPEALYESGVGHVRYPVAPLVFGHVEENVQQARRIAEATLRRFEPDGSLKYHPLAGGPDYSRTHYTNEANGLTSRSVLDLLQAASFCGDRALVTESLARLRALDRFRNGVPRGAQTWECPLHTPDILASAQMVRAYTLGYELSGAPDFLEQARYWAWTGVPFVYLVNPTDQAVGLYSTIAVYGATQWKAPVWLGLPVQWCGLVYADALYGLARLDRAGPWQKLADGITRSGLQQCWPPTEKASEGLLPDSFVLRAQQRNGPAINPATVQACAVQLFRQTPVYQFHCFRQNALLVHAPGAITNAEEKSGWVGFEIDPALEGSYFVLLNGAVAKPELKIDGRTESCASPHQFVEKDGRLILKLNARARVELKIKS